MTINLTPLTNPLEEQIAELKQTQDHHLTPFDVRLRRLLIQMYELIEDLQIEQRQMHNRQEKLSTEISSILEDLKGLKWKAHEVE
jgi:hypothetical protein